VLLSHDREPEPITNIQVYVVAPGPIYHDTPPYHRNWLLEFRIDRALIIIHQELHPIKHPRGM
jgi:hypothetical protein